MKKSLVVLAAMMMVFAMVGGVYAGTAGGDNPIVDVSATVSERCTMTSHGSLTIAIDPSVSGDQNFTPVQPSVKCTKSKSGTTATVTATSTNSTNASATGSVVGTLKNGDTTDIDYTFTFDPSVTGNGFGTGSDVNFNIGGYVAQTDAQAAEYSTVTYTDTITLTLVY